uniref:Putative metallophosphoesterase n=1 Tax=Magnetococcus massalia (strain MO-1) TaxID=451514 RepID=A0A1S7LNU8_MAGMO|nr:putative metallophosphoesterase [Candidatus Magnetococcus massalia]
MNFTFIHCADVHLDSPMEGITQRLQEAAQSIPFAQITRQAWQQLVDEAIDSQVDFIVVAGDLYDGDWKDYRTGIFFSTQAQRLAKANIPLYILYGNHDAANRLTKQISLPDNVHVFSNKQAATFQLEHLKVALHGWSYARSDMDENMARHYPDAQPGWFNLGLLHTALDGREGHSPYAPCTVADLLERGYDYWALGHVHAYEKLHEAPWILYPGNLQGRHVREHGEKGYLKVAVQEGVVDQVSWQPIHLLRWEQLTLQLPSPETADQLATIETALEQLVENNTTSPTIVRLTLQGQGGLLDQPDQLDAECHLLAKQVDEQLWIEKIKTVAMVQQESGLGEGGQLLAELLEGITEDAHLLEQLEQAMLGEMKSFPPWLRSQLIDGKQLHRAPFDRALRSGLEQLKQRIKAHDT